MSLYFKYSLQSIIISYSFNCFPYILIIFYKFFLQSIILVDIFIQTQKIPSYVKFKSHNVLKKWQQKKKQVLTSFDKKHIFVIN
jgi:hypothetical protein